jgi:hypothetical protein
MLGSEGDEGDMRVTVLVSNRRYLVAMNMTSG